MLNQHFTISQLRLFNHVTFRSLIEQEIYTGLPGRRYIPRKQLQPAKEAADYAQNSVASRRRAYCVGTEGNRTYFEITLNPTG